MSLLRLNGPLNFVLTLIYIYVQENDNLSDSRFIYYKINTDQRVWHCSAPAKEKKTTFIKNLHKCVIISIYVKKNFFFRFMVFFYEN
jgi:hypothetical protein